MMHKQLTLDFLDKLFIGILLIIFGGIVLHAPLTVGLSTVFPSVELLIKSWKEILMIGAGLLLVVILWRRRQWIILRSPILLLIFGYALLHIALIPLAYTGVDPTLAGLAIDLRYVAFFALVYVAMRLYPTMRRPFIITFVAGALVVAVFAILQVTVLPIDILKYLGYGEGTIQPYLYLDQNPDYIRINSTLRGPNSLGAYGVIVLCLLGAFWLIGKRQLLKRSALVAAVLGVGGLVAVWFSYSRSALAALVAAVGLVVVIALGKKFPRWLWATAAIAVVVVGLGLFVARDSSFVANVILHDNPTTGAEMTSNQGHVDSLQDGVDRMVHQPLGGGIGSTGSASLLGDKPLIIENQYLYIAHEVGWLGLGLFLVILWKLFAQLWQRRRDWLALGVFASGIGLVLIGLLLPILVDDTVAIIWWGLAALALGGSYGTLDKKTKRTA
ncbi:MAG: O-antigen ligase family protein [Candidatus Microsaccharimonas sp.]